MLDPKQYTQKEVAALSGDVKSYKLSRPMKWYEFKQLPENIQIEFVEFLVNEYAVGSVALARMFGVVPGTCSALFRKLKVSVNSYSTKANNQLFYDNFVDAVVEVTSPPIPMKEKSPEKIARHINKSHMKLSKSTIEFCGEYQPVELISKLSAICDLNTYVRMRIYIEAVGEQRKEPEQNCCADEQKEG